MGNALGVSGMVGFATILLVVMAILIVIADDRLKQITGYSTNNDLKTAHDKLVWAQVFGWIAAGLGLLLVLGYVVLHFLETSEWLHLILWILLFAALITTGVLLAIALYDIDQAKVNDDKDTNGYIWGALITGGVALLVLLISGGWRVVYINSTPYTQYYMQAEPAAPVESEPPEFPPQPSLQVTSGAVTAPN